MHTRAGLLDVVHRTHQSLVGLMGHCATLPDGAVDQSLDGFGYPTIHEQVHHQIGAQRYWTSVLRGAMDASGEPSDHATLAALEAWRQEVLAETVSFLEGTDEAALNEPRDVEVYGGATRALVPAQVILRTQTHVFQHNGQIAAMCRLLGHPIPQGLDYPIT